MRYEEAEDLGSHAADYMMSVVDIEAWDRFAAAALGGIVSEGGAILQSVIDAAEFADAMISERRKRFG